ncbi:TetR family transcriptional regulator [Rhizocola hellebori]|uniref:TetR family transcriptional regulator n=1 Tax=Rhizocola hellebori TaxID=1392758 RepID=A0A8J3QH48_9ACTN|nr:TetR/AcrR family transcriptional regulator [Rhizocola hellebori]GIH10773.1 TetR family transcriptional regulator [Rhizocola hellebori]
MTIAARTDETIRRDLIGAMAGCVAEKGYAATTIADIVAMAHVSKRTFYEHFTGKEDCLLAVYQHVCGWLMKVIRGAGTADQRWPERISGGAAAFLSALDSMPEFSRALLVEMQGAGERAFRMRQETLRGFAGTLVELVAAARPANPEIGQLTLPQALAIVGGINELLTQTLEGYGVPQPEDRPFSALHGDVVRLISAVLTYRPVADGSASM